MLTILNDTHLGAERSAGTTLSGRASLPMPTRRGAAEPRKPVEKDHRISQRLAKESSLPYELAAQLLSYNKYTGVLTWTARASEAEPGMSRRGLHQRVDGAVAGHLKTNGYVTVHVNGEVFLAHRLGWLLSYGTWPDDQVDHINTDRSDNRLENLRATSNRGNHANRTDNRSGHVGIIWEKSRSRWKAYIRVGYVMVNIGRYLTKDEAIAARCKYVSDKGIKC